MAEMKQACAMQLGRGALEVSTTLQANSFEKLGLETEFPARKEKPQLCFRTWEYGLALELLTLLPTLIRLSKHLAGKLNLLLCCCGTSWASLLHGRIFEP